MRPHSSEQVRTVSFKFESGGREPSAGPFIRMAQGTEERSMNGLIYLVGLVVVVGVILSFFGLR